MAIALPGTCSEASSKYTELNKLCVWYSADEYLAVSFSQSASKFEELIHFLERSLDSGII